MRFWEQIHRSCTDEQFRRSGLGSQAIGYASQHIWYLSQARIIWEGYARKGIRRKMVGMAEVGAQISLDCWCVCLCYLHFAPENPDALPATHPTASMH